MVSFLCCFVRNFNIKCSAMKRILLTAFCLVVLTQLHAQMTTRIVRDSLFIPWELVYGPDDNIWYTQKNGYICRLNPVTKVIDTLYHETNTVIQGEGGMLGMALHPNFPTDPYVYVAYNYTQSSTYRERVVRYAYSSGALQSPQVLLDNIAASNIHNGCRLIIIGDKLFITTGDAANQPSAQNLSSVNGKVLRINLDGTIPSDNPIAGNAAWSWGHRNAQGMVYAKNNIYISEHGPNSDDEISIVQKGRNYGWPTVHGFCNTPAEMTFCTDSNVVEPIMAWTPTLAVCGIDYYDHPMFPAWKNSLLMTTLKESKLYELELNGTYDSITTAAVIPNVSFGRIRDICIGKHGNVFISTSNSSSNGSNRIDKIIEIYDPSYVPPVAINNSTADGIDVYPNPAKDKVFVKIDASKKAPLFYNLLDMEGRVVSKGQLNTGSNSIQVEHLATGIYNLQIRNEHDVIAVKKISKR
jgi:aldose sugar dehydrogenase